jgi:hypothetical protein
MKLLLGCLLLLFFTACQSGQVITYPVTTTPLQPLQPAPQKVLLLNTFDAAVYHQRKAKESLVARLTDTLLKQMEAQLIHGGIETEALYGLTPVFTTADEGSIQALLQKHEASHAIVIKEVDLFFDQTGVEVTKTTSGKSREAFYDICSAITYDLYHTSGKIESRPVRLRKPHSSRSVVSGVLAAGPSIASNAKDFYNLATQNKDLFVHRYFGGFVTRQRSLFTTGAFMPVGTAIRQQKFETALKESLLLTESGNRETVARAYYNCAVLTERLNNAATARKYLQQSLRAWRLPQAMEMQQTLLD